MTLVVADTCCRNSSRKFGFLAPSSASCGMNERLTLFAGGPSNSLLGLRREIAGTASEHELAGLDRGEWEAIQLAKGHRGFAGHDRPQKAMSR